MITITISKNLAVFKLQYENTEGRQEIFFQWDLPYFRNLLFSGNEITPDLSSLNREELIRVANIIANEYEGKDVFNDETEVRFVFNQPQSTWY